MSGGKETDERLKKMEEMIMENGKQIRGLSDKFGGYLEAMARGLPSDAFWRSGSMLIIWGRSGLGKARMRQFWKWMFGGRKPQRHGCRRTYIMETKSKFRDKHIEQVSQLVERFRCKPLDYREERAVYPMLAAVEISEKQRREVWCCGDLSDRHQ